MSLYFNHFKTKSFFREFNIEEYNILPCEVLEKQFDFPLPEDFFLLNQSKVEADLFTSKRFYQFPCYYIDFDIILIPKENLPLNRNCLLVNQCNLFDRMTKLQWIEGSALNSDFYEIYFPVYYFNYFIQDFQHFGFINITIKSGKAIRINFFYYPLSFFKFYFFNEKKETNSLNQLIGELPIIFRDYYLTVYKIKHYSDFNVVISSRLYKEEYLRQNCVEMYQSQIETMEKISKTHEEIKRKFRKEENEAHKIHRSNKCQICNSQMSSYKEDINIIKEVHRRLFNRIKRANVQSSKSNAVYSLRDPKEGNELFKAKFFKEYVKFGNPFRYRIRRNFDKTKYVFQEDDVNIKEVLESRTDYRKQYNTEKRTAIKEYVEHCDSLKGQNMIELWEKHFNKKEEVTRSVQLPLINNTPNIHTQQITIPNEDKDTSLNPSTTICYKQENEDWPDFQHEFDSYVKYLEDKLFIQNAKNQFNQPYKEFLFQKMNKLQ